MILEEIDVTSPPHGSRRVLDLRVRSHLVATSRGRPGSPSTVGGQVSATTSTPAASNADPRTDVVSIDPGGTPGQGNAEADQRRDREGYLSPMPADPPGDRGDPRRAGGGRRRIPGVGNGTSPTGGLADIRADDVVSDPYTTGCVPIEFSCGFCTPESSSVKNQRVCPTSGRPLRVLHPGRLASSCGSESPSGVDSRTTTRASVSETARLNEDTPIHTGYPVGSRLVLFAGYCVD